MGIIDRIVTKLTDKAVDKYSDDMSQRSMWLIIAVAAAAAALLSAAPNTGPYSDEELQGAVLGSATDDELNAEIERRTKKGT